MTTFQNLGLSDALLKAVDEMGYETPSLIQEKAIPFVFMNRDILASAQTGTGKTASFILPMLDILNGGHTKPRMPRAIILEPTRELASQVGDNFVAYSKHIKLSHALIIGGTSMAAQEKDIGRGADVLIATPGRLLDLVGRGKVMLNEAKMLVIDEADRMMDMGFIPDVEKLVKMMPTMRQTIMFSATFPDQIKKLAEQFLDNPKEIIVTPPASTSDNITQYTIHLEAKEKYTTLRTLLDTQNVTTAIIFCNRKKDVDVLYRQLSKAKYRVGALHGDMDQSKRLEWLDKFRNDTVNILVCSDVAARGLDIANVSHVFNIDIPLQSEDYVHRIGRTGRAGKLGTSFSFISKNDKKLWTGVLNVTKKDVEEFKFKNSKVEQGSVAFSTGETGNKNKKNSNSNTDSDNKKKPNHKKTEKSDVPVNKDKSVDIDKTDNTNKSNVKKVNNAQKPNHKNSSKGNQKFDTDTSVQGDKKHNNSDTKSNNSNPNPNQNKKRRFDSQEGIGEIENSQSNLPFGEQDTLPSFLKGK